MIIYIYTYLLLDFLSGQNDGMSQPALTILKSQLDCPESCDVNMLGYYPIGVQSASCHIKIECSRKVLLCKLSSFLPRFCLLELYLKMTCYLSPGPRQQFTRNDHINLNAVSLFK